MFVTISRQYAAGGSQVASLVAAGLGWDVVDNEFLDALAERSGYSREEVADLDERVPSFFERFAQSTTLSFPEYLATTPGALDEPGAEKLARISRDLVAELGRRDRMVMVGRAAAAVLARESGAIHVRVVAPREVRIQTAIDRLGVAPGDAESILDDTDRNRDRYHREYYDRDWNDPENYHMVFNTELVGVDRVAELVIAYARSLGW
jgi:cytidylate kinase